MPSTPRIPLLLGLPLMLAVGVLLPLQGRINGALAVELDDAVTASLVSFTTGLVVMLLVTVLLPRGRAGIRNVLPALRERRFPRWYVLAGMSGAFFVLMQATTIGPLGVAIFTVAVVTGQSLSGLVVDRIGVGPGGRRRINAARLAGALLTLAAVVIALSPRINAEAEPAQLILLVLLPMLAGLFSSLQHAVNGTAAVAYGTPITATTLNFLVGGTTLALIWTVQNLAGGTAGELPSEWWYYIGGPLGAIFVGLTTLLVRTMGVLLVSLGMIAGQLLGSLALDVIAPTAGTVIAPATIAGTVLTLAAVVLATLPWPRRRPLRQPAPVRQPTPAAQESSRR